MRIVNAPFAPRRRNRTHSAHEFRATHGLDLREVARRALAVNAAAGIFAHNHPSGEVTPSPEDVRLTQRLKDMLSVLEVRVLDHFAIAANRSCSFAERRLI